MRKLNRFFVVSTVVFLCALAGMGYATEAQAKSSVATGTAKVEKRIEKLEKRAHKYESAAGFFKTKDRRWMLYLNQQDVPCWKVNLHGPLKLCMVARGAVRVNTQRLRKVQANIEQLESLLLDTGIEDNWKCIHRYERHPLQGWATRTGNGYYGGLQMDLSFQRAHGLDLLLRKGTANNWTSKEQMMVAQRAHDGVRTSYGDSGAVVTWQDKPRGYNPWPNTARSCGLLK